MKLSVDSLRATGGFSGAPVKREVTWQTPDGEDVTADVWIRRMSYHTAVGDARSVAEGGDLIAARIVNSVVDEEGKPVFCLSDITGVDPEGNPVLAPDEDGNLVERGALSRELTNSLLEVIGEVNELGKQQSGTDSSPKKNSGTS